MMEHQGKLTSVVYKQVHEENQKQLKLTEVLEFLGNDSKDPSQESLQQSQLSV